MTDMINHPPHYTATEYEPIDIIAAIGNPYCRGNALKYIARAGRKGDAVEDLKKARWYVQRLLKTQEAFTPLAVGDASEVASAWSGQLWSGACRREAIMLLLTNTRLPVAQVTQALDDAIEGVRREAEVAD